jgi:hypothetical protein
MFSRWIVTNITSASVTTFLAGIISWSVYCIKLLSLSPRCFLFTSTLILSFLTLSLSLSDGSTAQVAPWP